MSAARTFSILVSLTILLAIMVFVGCSPERTGTAASNSIPEVYLVNTPPDSAQFSRNPDLNWYATDIDGYIAFFRYAVVIDSTMMINGIHVTPAEFADQATDEQFGWDTLFVDLDHPQATATIRLYANVDFPVDSFITQYFFIQAQDDRGALSEIKWRMYSRNNNFPNTHFRALQQYINAPDPTSPAPGVSLTWEGADSADYGRAEPPLEFEWRLFGPFEESAIIRVKLVKENCIYDPTVDSFVNCIDIPILDLENLPPALNNLPQPLMHSEGPNYANDSTDVWVTETQTTLYDVYRDLELTKTSKYKFVFWVRARDDGFVPDPTPSFAQFNVYEAKFENPVMVIDETGYDLRNGRWAPVDIDSAKAYFYNVLHDSMGYTGFDTTYHFDDTGAQVGPDHYFYSATKGDRANRPLPSLYSAPQLIDVLAHKVIIFYNDDAAGGPNETPFGFMRFLFSGLDMGASAWILSRNLGDAALSDERGTEKNKSISFMMRFGISMVVCEGWLNGLFFIQPPYFNEEFIGAYSNIEGYPHLTVDYGPGSRLDQIYSSFFIDPSHTMVALPEIGVGTRTQFSAPLYLYLSKDGDLSFFHGKVNGVLQQLGDMRTACFMFTPLAMEQPAMMEVFNTVIPWLSEKFDGAEKASLKNIPAYETSFSSISERRARLDRFLEYMSEEASPEEKALYGMGDLKPFVVTPAGAEK